ncbi:MAG: CoA transferase, partial [Actinomycetota bacterium]
LVAAMRHRDRTGVGQYLDISQNEAGVHHLGPLVNEYAATGNLLERPGTASETGAPSGVFRGAGSERYLAVSAITDAHWSGLVEVCDAMAPFAGFDRAARLAARADIETAFASWLADRDVFETQATLLAAGCPAYVSLRATDLIRDPQLEHRGFFTPLEHRVIDARFDGPVSHFSSTPHAPWRAGPTIGEHNEQILKDLLGFTDDEITELAIADVLT